MCGRTACTLDKCCLTRACSYKGYKKQLQVPEWRDVCPNQDYYPSFNKAPGSLSPVLISKSQLDDDSNCDERLICPMSWGLIPSWHKGDPKSFSLKTNNCRAETILQKPTYSHPLKKGKRCVVLADGFYEWKREKKSKQPYFIFFPQNTKMEQREWVAHKDDWWGPKKGWCGPRLLTMAGLYDVWTDKNGSELYSFAVVTVEASSELSWMHDRMPAILDGDEAVSRWLNHVHVPHLEAVNLLAPILNLEWYPVSSVVNNSRNHDVDCVLPLKKSPQKEESTTLMKWLQPKESLPASASSSPPPPKKSKGEK